MDDKAALAQARTVARELSESGHPRGAQVIHALAAMIERLTRPPDAQAEARLRAVIRHALPHQTNTEVERWLRAALSRGSAPIFDNQGRRVDE